MGVQKWGIGVAAALLVAAPAQAKHGPPQPQPPTKQPVATGSGGGAASMSPYATQAAIDVMKRGGNAVDGAVAAASTLGVTEPFVAGPGGGGFFVYYRARDHKVFTIDGREKAPGAATPQLFIDPATGQPLPFETAVESGLSVGVPGQVATWDQALKNFGTKSLRDVFRPAEQVALKGFPLDQALVGSIQSNKDKLARFPDSAKLYLPNGQVPPVGYTLRNPDLAKTYAMIGVKGAKWFYDGPIAADLVKTVQKPPTVAGKEATGSAMTTADMRAYTAPLRDPVSWDYRGYKLFGMGPPSSGGTTVGEAMNILETLNLGGNRIDALYDYIEALKLAFADRGKYVGDTDFVNVPLVGLLSKGFAAERAKLINPAQALTAPVDAGDPAPFNGAPAGAPMAIDTSDHEQHTNHLVVADKDGNVVSYTNTIEQIAGSGITVPGRGFLLNNELTDFNFPPGTANSVQANKRPRSSMAPTIVTKNGRVVEAIGSPGGATIITTVLQILVNQLDFGMSLPDAIEAPRASQRNAATTDAEPGFISAYGPDLTARGEAFNPCCAGAAGLPQYIGIAAGLQFGDRGTLTVATESTRGGGGSAMVMRPAGKPGGGGGHPGGPGQGGGNGGGHPGGPGGGNGPGGGGHPGGGHPGGGKPGGGRH